MDLFETSRREKRQSFIVAIALAAIVSLLGAPVVQAAVQRVKLAGGTANVKIKDTNGGDVDSKRVPDMGLFDAQGSAGAIAVRNFAGGGGFLAAIDCSPAAVPQPNTAVLGSGAIITGIIMTGNAAGADAVLGVESEAIGPINLMHMRVNAAHPNDFVGLGNGLTLTDNLTFECDDGAGGAGQGQVIILGQ